MQDNGGCRCHNEPRQVARLVGRSRWSQVSEGSTLDQTTFRLRRLLETFGSSKHTRIRSSWNTTGVADFRHCNEESVVDFMQGMGFPSQIRPRTLPTQQAKYRNGQSGEPASGWMLQQRRSISFLIFVFDAMIVIVCVCACLQGDWAVQCLLSQRTPENCGWLPVPRMHANKIAYPPFKQRTCFLTNIASMCTKICMSESRIKLSHPPILWQAGMPHWFRQQYTSRMIRL